MDRKEPKGIGLPTFLLSAVLIDYTIETHPIIIRFNPSKVLRQFCYTLCEENLRCPFAVRTYLKVTSTYKVHNFIFCRSICWT